MKNNKSTYSFIVLADQGGESMNVMDNLSPTIRANMHGRPPIILQKAWSFNPDVGATYNGIGFLEEVSNPLKVGGRPGGVV